MVDGKIAEQGSYTDMQRKPDLETIKGLQHSTEHYSEPAQPNDDNLEEIRATSGLSSPDGSLEATRQTGDWSVYSYYADAAGLINTLVFSGLSACIAFFYNFPSVYILCHH